MFEYPRSGMFNLRVSYMNHNYRPPVDVIETTTGYLIRIEIAGVNESDFNIRYDHNVLNVSGTRQDSYKNFTFHQMEIHFGEFEVQIAIPNPIEESITAEYKSGFLEISMKKATPKKIHIKDKDA